MIKSDIENERGSKSNHNFLFFCFIFRDDNWKRLCGGYFQLYSSYMLPITVQIYC